MKDRLEGFIQALNERKIKFTRANIAECGTNNTQNYILLKKKLLLVKKPDGILASIENLSIILYHVCADIKLSIPGELKVISFSNLDSVSLLNPPLTTVTQPAYEIGRMSASILVKGLEKKKFIFPNETITIPSELFKRGSTAADH